VLSTSSPPALGIFLESAAKVRTLNIVHHWKTGKPTGFPAMV
jgi:hypothetical protein